MSLKLNDKLDLIALSNAYRDRKRLQVRDFLSPEGAEKIHQSLLLETPWGFIYYGDDKSEKLPHDVFEKLSPAEKAQIYQKIFATARDSYQYMYYFFPIFRTYEGKGQSDIFLYQVLEFMNSEPVLEFARKLTGIQEINFCDAQATRYIGNCFLHSHKDQSGASTRRAAYVLNLTKKWDPNWGGYLQFFREDLNIDQAFKPDFNVLNVFTVPQPHSVSTVAPYCPGQRLSITGWFHEGEVPDYGN